MTYDISVYGGAADGITDCSTALDKILNAVIDSIQNNKEPEKHLSRIVELPVGDYYFSRPIEYSAASANGIQLIIKGTVYSMPKTSNE